MSQIHHCVRAVYTQSHVVSSAGPLPDTLASIQIGSLEASTWSVAAGAGSRTSASSGAQQTSSRRLLALQARHAWWSGGLQDFLAIMMRASDIPADAHPSAGLACCACWAKGCRLATTLVGPCLHQLHEAGHQAKLRDRLALRLKPDIVRLA